MKYLIDEKLVKQCYRYLKYMVNQKPAQKPINKPKLKLKSPNKGA